MPDLELVDEVKSYVFSWKIKGYDCGPTKIRSPVFTVNFQVTEFYMEIDLSKFRNVDSFIPFRLQRVPGIGPKAVTFDLKLSVKLGENKEFRLEKSQAGKIFSEAMGNFWAFNIYIPVQKLEFKSKDELNWFNPKHFLADIEIKSSCRRDPIFPKRFWNSKNSLTEVLKSLKTLREEGSYHDLILKVSGEEFRLHKSILNARWPRLVATLNIKESSNEVETIEFSGISPNLLKFLMDYAYFGSLDFMYSLGQFEDGFKIFEHVRKYNFFRLNDKITQISSQCSSLQFVQSYRTSINMKLKNVTSTETPMGDFKTCEIPLKPRHLPKSSKPLLLKEREKFERHIKFLDIRIYVDKGPLGYNWLMFSIVLGQIPKDNPVIIKCKLYVVSEEDIKYLLTEKNLMFDQSTEVSFKSVYREGKICKRYKKVSGPIITWRELTDESRNLMRKRTVSVPNSTEENDLHFVFEIKLADGEYVYDSKHGDCEITPYGGDYAIFQDMELVYNDVKYANFRVTSGDRFIKAHKAILSARSKVFEDILREKPELKSLPINVQPDNLHILVHYIYTGQLHEVSRERMTDLMSAAVEYKLDCLQDILNQRLEGQLVEEPEEINY